MKDFVNMSYIDPKNPKHVAVGQEALAHVRTRLGTRVELSGGGSKTIVSRNPFGPEDVVGELSALSPEYVVDQQIPQAQKAFSSWQRTSVSQRQSVMENIATQIEKHRFEFNAWMMLEVGKTWIEADADTCEAIDFVRYYAMNLPYWQENKNLVRIPGQDNQMVYVPLGVGVVIAPWNFPLAILCGMTTASLVTGNTVLMKPSADAAMIAYRFHEILMEAGVPEGVVQLAMGNGADVGEALVKDPRVRFICFTGSREVGCRIYQEGAKVQPGQIWLKRMILEMGGKDGIFVDETADLDAASQGVVASAFGFSGQKCSACSRLIVHESVKEALLEKVLAQTQTLVVGNPTDPSTHMGPVINQASFEKIGNYVELGKKEGTIILGGTSRPDMGYTWNPTIFDGITKHHRLFQEEVFGPVLGVTSVGSFEEGIQMMNATEFGLTGSVYSKDKKRIQRAIQDIYVGNLYINRKCTGAMVGQHPFGGFNMSGTDSKAGGPDYLGQFVQPKCVAEATG